MRIKHATTAKIPKPFIKNETTSIHLEDDKGMITAVVVIHNNRRKEFKVSKYDILAAWKKMERFLDTLT